MAAKKSRKRMVEVSCVLASTDDQVGVRIGITDGPDRAPLEEKFLTPKAARRFAVEVIEAAYAFERHARRQ